MVLCMQVRYHSSEMLKIRSVAVSEFGDFGILHVHDTFQGLGPNINRMLIYVSYEPYIHGLKVIFCNTFGILGF